MAFSDSFLAELRARLPVSRVVARKIELKKQGSEFVGLSPFQKESTPSFTVNDSKGFYHDFSSGRHGDIFGWFVDAEGCTFPEAVEKCADLAGISLPRGDGRPKDRERSSATRKQGDGSAFGAAANGHGGPVSDGTAAIGESPREANGADASPASRDAAKGRREIVATYDYTSAQGDLLYQVVRFEWTENGKRKKSFGQRRPFHDEPGVWIWGLGAGEYMRRDKGDWYQYNEDRWKQWSCNDLRKFSDHVEHGLYRLVEMRETGADEPVFLPEGEKDVDTLCGWGLAATTNSGGASNWRADHAALFRGRDVVILPDNDQPGRERGEKIAATLHRIASRVRVLSFAAAWPDAPKGADVTDWKRHREGTAEELAQIVASLPDWRPPPFLSRFGGIPFEGLDAPGPEHEFLVDGWSTVGDKSIIGGPSKSGKSFLAVHKAGCIATGMEFFGNKVMAPGLVVYQAGEGARGIKKRFRAWRQYFQIPKDRRVPIYILQSKIDLWRSEGDTGPLIDEIKGIQTLYDEPLRAIFIDTLATATGGADENSGRDMSMVMANVDRIAASVPGVHVCLVHHFNAAGTKLRGHTSIYNNIDQVVLVTKEEGSKVRTAILDKQKDGEDGAVIKFELFSVEIGKRAVDGKPVTSCVTLSVGASISATESRQTLTLSDQQTNIVNALKRALDDNGEPTPDMLRLPRSIRTVTKVKHWYDAYRQVAGENDDSAVRQALKRANDKLLRLRVIGRSNPYVWLTGRSVAGAVIGAHYGEASSSQSPPTPLPDDAQDIS